MLLTIPVLTGSPPITNTIGISVVAALAAMAVGVPPVATMTLTERRTNSVASSGNRSNLPSAQRKSIVAFRPSA